MERERGKVGWDGESGCDSGLWSYIAAGKPGWKYCIGKISQKALTESTPSSSGQMLDLGRGSARTKEGIKVTGLEIVSSVWVTASPEFGISES